MNILLLYVSALWILAQNFKRELSVKEEMPLFLTKILDFWRKRLCKEPDSQRPLLPGRDIHNEPYIGNWKKLQLLNNFHHFFFFNNLYLGNL